MDKGGPTLTSKTVTGLDTRAGRTEHAAIGGQPDRPYDTAFSTCAFALRDQSPGSRLPDLHRLVVLEVLHRPVMLFRGGPTGERAQVSSLAAPRIDFPRVQAIFSRTEFADHDDFPSFIRALFPRSPCSQALLGNTPPRSSASRFATGREAESRRAGMRDQAELGHEGPWSQGKGRNPRAKSRPTGPRRPVSKPSHGREFRCVMR